MGTAEAPAGPTSRQLSAAILQYSRRCSIRAALLEQWQELGLAAAPSVKENGLHASASPLEALVERQIWLNRGDVAGGFQEDPFGTELAAAGVPASRAVEWATDPPIKASWGASESLFDALEDMDVGECLEKLLELHSSDL